jgi:sugar fermentation stimulation protein A
VAVERDGMPVMLHTHHTNTVAAHLLREGRVPGLEGAEIARPEYRVGHSRFDFLLRKDGRDFLLEVKSCTLFHDTLAMFPDAVSARATRHLLELEDLSRRGYGAGVLFVVHSPKARYFMPEHHTDLEFCRALLRVKEQVMIRAVSAEWTRDLTLAQRTRELIIPWDLVEREAHDRGNYIVVLGLPRDRRITVGSLGEVKFRKGYYLYAGSAKKDLGKRLARHQRLTKKHHWHIDHLRQHAEFIAGIPIRTSVDRECELAATLAKITDGQVPGFGCSDCACPSHLFSMDDDPFTSRAFSDLLLYFRMGKLEELLEGKKEGT